MFSDQFAMATDHAEVLPSRGQEEGHQNSLLSQALGLQLFHGKVPEVPREGL